MKTVLIVSHKTNSPFVLEPHNLPELVVDAVLLLLLESLLESLLSELSVLESLELLWCFLWRFLRSFLLSFLRSLREEEPSRWSRLLPLLPAPNTPLPPTPDVSGSCLLRSLDDGFIMFNA